jgi:hypothetical protein
MLPKTSLHRLAFALAMATCLAVPMAAHATAIKSTSGLIAGDGTRKWGHGFTSQHLGAGDYILSFSAGAFPIHAPIFTCSPAGVEFHAAICDVWFVDWHTDSPSTAEIHLYSRVDGAMEDNAFDFIEMTAH